MWISDQFQHLYSHFLVHTTYDEGLKPYMYYHTDLRTTNHFCKYQWERKKMEKRNETITAASDLSLCPRWIFHDQRSFFDGWICQRWRQLQTFESLNKGNCLTGLQQTSVMEQSERKQEASRKLQNQRGRRERDGRGTELIWSSWGHPNLKGPRTLLTQLCLEPGDNF